MTNSRKTKMKMAHAPNKKNPVVENKCVNGLSTGNK